MSNRAWVTLATNDSYGLGALVLAHSLRRANSAHPAVVLITPSVTEAMRNRLSAVFAEVITVNVLDSQDAAHLALLQRPELGITFTKIHCWTLTQYQKCVFLDADTLIVQNCDELFDREELSAAPDVGWPDCFNSGVFVFVPSQETYTRLITFAQERGSFDGGDQGLLNAFFADWAHGDINKHLPFLYNVTSAAFYSYIPALKYYGQDLKIIHFIGTAKPWLQQFNWESRSVDAPEHLRQFLQLWWDLFVGQVHTQLDSAMELAVEEEQGPLESPPEDSPEDTQYHYEPEINVESEFPWHWPEAENQESENNVNQLNMSEVHDPWEHYRGNIPPKQDFFNQHSEHRDMQQKEEEIRKHAWEYRESDQNVWQQTQQQEHIHHQQHLQHSQHHSYHQEPYIQNPSKHDHSHELKFENFDYQHQQQTFREHQSHYEYTGHHGQDNFKRNDRNNHHEGDHQQSIEQQVWHNLQNQSHHEHSHFEEKYEHSIKSQHYNQFNGHSHNFHNDNQKHHDFDLSHSQESHKHLENSQRYDRDDVLHHHESQTQKNSEIRLGHNHNGYTHLNPYTYQKNIEPVYQLHLDHRPRRTRQRRSKMDCIHEVNSNELANGHLSDSESEEELIIPRHPYDGFYLRHRPTIDPRGHKICTHEIPPTPLPSPPAEEPSSRESSPTPCEDFETASECEDQYESGVAGNLARVVPGSGSFQRDAIDELTRRQGWEAGNIDYMGADSFDNIWAKISQTLNQPPKQPSPPRKEPTPPKEPSPPKEQPQSEETPKPVEVPATAAAPDTPPTPASTAVPKDTSIPTPAPAATPEAAPAPTPAEPAQSVATSELPKPVEEVISEALKPKPTQKTDSTVPPTPPATPKSSPEASSPVTESAPEAQTSPAVAEALKATEPFVDSPIATVKASATAKPKPTVTPEKPQDSSVTTTASTDSPPLANTPSKEEVPAVAAPKTEERRKPVEKLQLSPPAAADAMPTPDSELEDAAALAHAIIASELSTSVTAPSPAADVASPPPLEGKRLSVEAPEVPSPPVSLAQIGVKPKGKPTTAAQIETSVSEKAEPAASETPEFPTTPAVPETNVPATPTAATIPAPPTDGKKKPAKKVTKKEGGPSGDTPTPVPPPRKKEKKPKEK